MTMKTDSDKNLMILGFIKAHSTHGYQITELLNSVWVPVKVGKANVYRILEAFKKDGLLTSAQERQGKHPVRQVYSITKEGEKFFKTLLKKRLPEKVFSDLPDAVSLNFLDFLPEGEVIKLLKKRLALIEKKLAGFKDISPEDRESHPGVDFLISQTGFEHDWLLQFIQKLQHRSDK